MKIGLLTYFWENNTGQYWQAYAALKALRAGFPQADVELVNVRHWGELRNNVISPKVLLTPWKLYGNYQSLRGFRVGRQRNFSYSQQECLTHDYEAAMRFIEAQGYDLLVVGADVVLKPLSESRVGGQVPLYWLSPELSAPKALLASSADITRADTLAPAVAERMARSLSGFQHIGVRDSMTARLCQALGTARVPICRVPDPAFSLAPDPAWAQEAARVFPKASPGRKRALIHFSHQPGVDTIIATLGKMGFDVVCLGKPLPGAPSHVSLSPTAWAAMSTCVDLVVTMSFHESIFATKYARPVLAIDVQANRFDASTFDSKLVCLMEDLGLQATHHLNPNAPGDFAKRLESSIQAVMATDYAAVQRKHQAYGEQYRQAVAALATTPAAAHT